MFLMSLNMIIFMTVNGHLISWSSPLELDRYLPLARGPPRDLASRLYSHLKQRLFCVIFVHLMNTGTKNKSKEQ